MATQKRSPVFFAVRLGVLLAILAALLLFLVLPRMRTTVITVTNGSGRLVADVRVTLAAEGGAESQLDFGDLVDGASKERQVGPGFAGGTLAVSYIQGTTNVRSASHVDVPPRGETVTVAIEADGQFQVRKQ
jgi:hypothetical protein